MCQLQIYGQEQVLNTKLGDKVSLAKLLVVNYRIC